MQLNMDPRTLCCLIGVAVRIGQRMGLSIDGTSFGLLPFEVEMRRRLWWQITLTDTRISVMSGAGLSVLMYDWTTHLPSNINDSDLFPEMREMPSDRADISEIIFLRLRCEVEKLMKEILSGHNSIPESDRAIADFEKRISREYLARCDASIPLHFLTIVFTRTSFNKLRMTARFPHRRTILSEADPTISQEEKDLFFQLS
jgi:hypothetical protein